MPLSFAGLFTAAVAKTIPGKTTANPAVGSTPTTAATDPSSAATSGVNGTGSSSQRSVLGPRWLPPVQAADAHDGSGVGLLGGFLSPLDTSTTFPALGTTASLLVTVPDALEAASEVLRGELDAIDKRV